jgi:hypothetical protein
LAAAYLPARHPVLCALPSKIIMMGAMLAEVSERYGMGVQFGTVELGKLSIDLTSDGLFVVMPSEAAGPHAPQDCIRRISLIDDPRALRIDIPMRDNKVLTIDYHGTEMAEIMPSPRRSPYRHFEIAKPAQIKANPTKFAKLAVSLSGPEGVIQTKDLSLPIFPEMNSGRGI